MVEDRSTAGSPSTMNAHSPDASTTELISRLSEQSSALVRSEIQLAQAEISRKVKHAGLGAGAFGVAGLLTVFGLGVLLTSGILALSLVLPAWLAALIVATLLVVAAAVAMVIGRKQVKQATPPLPQRSVESVKRDVETLKGVAAP